MKVFVTIVVIVVLSIFGSDILIALMKVLGMITTNGILG